MCAVECVNQRDQWTGRWIFSSSLSLRSYDEIIELLKEVDIQTLTPLDALNKLLNYIGAIQ